MKKNLLFLALVLVALSASAQQNQTPAEQPAAIVAQPALRFGYFSFEQVFHTMPGYAIAKHNMDELRAKYDEETKRVEKRQAELRELMEKNIAFKAEAAKLLNQAETDAYAPLKTQINEAAKQIGKEKGFAFIINTDNNATPYLSEEMGEDITAVLEEKLK